MDDSDVMRAIIRSHLQNIGVTRIQEAFSAKKALDILESHPGIVDLIISDWNMPGMQGIDFLAEIRKSEKYKDVAFLMVTAEQTPAHVGRAIRTGVSGFLPKPFTKKMLESKLHKIFRDRKQGP